MGILQDLADEVTIEQVKDLLPIIRTQLIRNSIARGFLNHNQPTTFDWETLRNESTLLGWALIQETPQGIPIRLFTITTKGQVDWNGTHNILDAKERTQFLSIIQAEET